MAAKLTWAVALDVWKVGKLGRASSTKGPMTSIASSVTCPQAVPLNQTALKGLEDLMPLIVAGVTEPRDGSLLELCSMLWLRKMGCQMADGS